VLTLSPDKLKAVRLQWKALETAAKATNRSLALLKAKDDLISFVKIVMPTPDHPDDHTESRYVAKKHHQAIAAALEEVEAGRILRLIINMPPRHGKSEISSRKFPAWFMGRNPYSSIIFATYNEQFSLDFGREFRNLVNTPVYRSIFPKFELREGSASAERLVTIEGGMVAFVGRGGSITGRGADCLIIDDPIKDDEEANSPAQRDKLWQWFTNTAMSRLMTVGARVVLIQTRWHEDDLVGRLTDPTNPCYDEEVSKQWKVLDLPAIAMDNDAMGRNPGEALWPERFSIEYLDNARRLNPRGFSALYQGRPAPDDGDFFKAQFISTYKQHQLPRNLRVYAASDHAVSTRQDRDATCLLVAGICEKGDIWILPDCWWQRQETDKVVEAMLNIMEARKPLFWWAERGHISKSIGPFLRKRMQERSVYCALIEQTPVQDKQTRAQAIQARMSMRRVHFPDFVPWWPEAREQMLKFPHGRNDDFVDALAHLGLGLQSQVSAKPMKASNILSFPKTGTIEWVRAAADLERKQKIAAIANGGF